VYLFIEKIKTYASIFKFFFNLIREKMDYDFQQPKRLRRTTHHCDEVVTNMDDQTSEDLHVTGVQMTSEDLLSRCERLEAQNRALQSERQALMRQVQELLVVGFSTFLELNEAVS